MNDRTILRVGVVAALCCLTPVLVILLGALGLSAAPWWLDYVLLPALVISLGLLGFGLWKRRTRGSH